jgi:membrane protein
MNLKDVREKVSRAWRFVSSDVWDVELTSLSRLHGLGVRAVRVIVLVFHGFNDDECPLHASALTFNTLMAIVPVLALSLSLARVFGGAELAREKVQLAVREWTQQFSSGEEETPPEVLPDAEAPLVLPSTNALAAAVAGTEAPDDGLLTPEELAEEITAIIDDGFEKVEQISFTALGGVGLVLLLWMVIVVLGRVESSFNRVWGVTVARSLWRRFTDYLSVIIIFPFLVIAATSLPVIEMVSRPLDPVAADMVRNAMGSAFLKTLTVLTMTTLCFTFITMFLPNARVRYGPGFAGGFVAAALFLTWLRVCAGLQVGVARYGKIYGSFAVVPILLAWVYVSWQIVLFGAEVAFAVQNCATYKMEQGAHRANVRSRLTLALSVVVEAARAMLGEAGVFDAGAYARVRRVPVRFLNGIVDELVHMGLLAELSDRPSCYVLLKSPSALRIADVMDAVMRSGVEPSALGLGQVDACVADAVVRVEGGMDTAMAQATVQDLLKGNAGADAAGAG